MRLLLPLLLVLLLVGVPRAGTRERPQAATPPRPRPPPLPRLTRRASRAGAAAGSPHPPCSRSSGCCPSSRHRSGPRPAAAAAAAPPTRGPVLSASDPVRRRRRRWAPLVVAPSVHRCGLEIWRIRNESVSASGEGLHTTEVGKGNTCVRCLLLQHVGMAGAAASCVSPMCPTSSWWTRTTRATQPEGFGIRRTNQGPRRSNGARGPNAAGRLLRAKGLLLLCKSETEGT